MTLAYYFDADKCRRIEASLIKVDAAIDNGDRATLSLSDEVRVVLTKVSTPSQDSVQMRRAWYALRATLDAAEGRWFGSLAAVAAATDQRSALGEHLSYIEATDNFADGGLDWASVSSADLRSLRNRTVRYLDAVDTALVELRGNGLSGISTRRQI